MAQATSTALGEIKLAGDLAGTATLPQLSNTGVTAGAYFLPSLTVDAKGRITAATNGSVSDILNVIPDATHSVKGIAKIGSNIEVTTTQTQGSQTVNYGGTLTGTTNLGLCTNSPSTTYSFTYRLDGGTSYTITASTRTTINDLITELNSKLTGATIGLVSGNLRLISATQGTASKILLTSDNLFKFIIGYVQIDTAIDGQGESTIFVLEASKTQKGVAKFGSGFSVDSSGYTNFDPSVIGNATTTSKGVAQIGAGISVSGGIISTSAIPDATSSTKGVVQLGANIVYNSGTGSIDIPQATNSTPGVFKVGFGLKTTDGYLGLDTTALATATTPGLVKIGSGLSVTNGVLSAGGQIASASALGMVKIGAGVSVTGDGTISTSGVSVPDATYSSKGIVQVGANLTVTNGLLSVGLGNGTTPGVVKINTAVGLSVTNGVVSAVLANGTTIGVVRVADTNNLTATAGAIDVGANIAKKDSANTFTKAQVVALSTPAFASTMTLDFSNSNSFSFTATSDFTLANPSNIVAGGVYYIIIKQDATGGRNISWGSNFKFRGLQPSISSTGGSTSIIAIMAVDTGFLATEVFTGY